MSAARARRVALGVGVALAAAAAVAALARRGGGGPSVAAEARGDSPSRIAPGTVTYALEQGGVAVGYAVSTLDTAGGAVTVVDSIVTSLPIGGKLNRVSGALRTRLTRTLALRDFALAGASPGGPIAVTGRTVGDSVLVLAIAANGLPADTQRVTVRGPVLLPTVVPLALALGEPPSVGRRYALATFDPLSLAPREARFTVHAESLFAVPDSAARDARTGRWRAVRTRAVRAWRLVADGGAGFQGWVGDDGRVVQLDQAGGFVLRRTSRALAESNWTLAAGARRRGSPMDADILESTAVAASAPLRTGLLSRLTVRLTNVELAGFEVAGGAQTLDGTTLTVRRDRRDGLAPGYALPASGELRARFARELAAEPLLQAGAPEIVALARRVGGGSRDPVEVAERLTRWLHDSLRKDITIGVPSALQTLASRNGDCNEHTQLYLALARASGLPARGAAGLARVGKKFYYHAWPEVYLGRWVAVDPTFGEFPADAGHLRFVTGGLGRQAELLRLIGTLGIDVVESR